VAATNGYEILRLASLPQDDEVTDGTAARTRWLSWSKPPKATHQPQLLTQLRWAVAATNGYEILRLASLPQDDEVTDGTVARTRWLSPSKPPKATHQPQLLTQLRWAVASIHDAASGSVALDRRCC